MDLTEFTTEELLALASGLGLRDPAFLAGSPVGSWPAEVRAEVDAIGRRSLAARSVIHLDDDGTARVPDVLATLCGVIADPEVYMRIANVDGAGVRMASFLVTHEACAGLRLTRLGNYRFTLIAATDAWDAIDEILDLADPRYAEIVPGGAADVEVPIDEIQRLAAEHASRPDAEMESLVRGSGITPSVADALLPLLTDGSVGWSVEVFVPSVATRSLTGSATVWVATSTGIRIVEAVGDERDAVRYRRATGDAVRTSIEEGVPAWLRR